MRQECPCDMEERIRYERIIGCAKKFTVNSGQRWKVYETPLQLVKNGLRFERQRVIPLMYEGVYVGDYKPDLIVEGEVVVDVKSVLQFQPVFIAQMLTYLHLRDLVAG